MPSKMFQGTFLPFVFKKIVLVEAAWKNKAMKRVVVGGGEHGNLKSTHQICNKNQGTRSLICSIFMCNDFYNFQAQP